MNLRTGGGDVPRRRGWHSDVWVAAVILAFLAVAFALTATFEDIHEALAQGMQASAFPRLVIGVIAVLTLIMAWHSRHSPDPARPPLPAAFATTVAGIAAVVGVLYVAGLMAAIPVAVIGMGRLWGERRWWLLALIAVCLAVGIRLLFLNGFGVQLPRGLLDLW